MSLDRTDYIVYGWKLPKSMRDKDGNDIDFWDDRFLPYIEGHSGEEYTLVRDDDFMAFGKLIGSNYDGWKVTHLDVRNIDIEAIRNKYCEVFDAAGSIAEPYLFIFSHWS
jgi:hypothetical protein